MIEHLWKDDGNTLYQGINGILIDANGYYFKPKYDEKDNEKALLKWAKAVGFQCPHRVVEYGA